MLFLKRPWKYPENIGKLFIQVNENLYLVVVVVILYLTDIQFTYLN